MPTVWVVWEFDYDNPEEKEYSFDTEAELDAFVLGITEADPDNTHHSFCKDEEEVKKYMSDRELDYESEDD